MTFDKFSDFENKFLADMGTLLDTKGHDYAGGKAPDVDRLGNFKKAAAEIGVSPAVVWFIYFKKHVDSVATFVKTGRNTSEPIYGRLLDIANYALLGAALLEDDLA